MTKWVRVSAGLSSAIAALALVSTALIPTAVEASPSPPVQVAVDNGLGLIYQWGLSSSGPVAISSMDPGGQGLGVGRGALDMPVTVTNMSANGGSEPFPGFIPGGGGVGPPSGISGEFDVPSNVFQASVIAPSTPGSAIPSSPDPTLINAACHALDVTIGGYCVAPFILWATSQSGLSARWDGRTRADGSSDHLLLRTHRGDPER